MNDLINRLIELAYSQVEVRRNADKIQIFSETSNLDSSTRQFLADNKSAILHIFSKLGIDSTRQIAHLSHAQRRLWLIDQIESGSQQFNMPTALSLDGKLDIHALRDALNDIVKRHQILRTTIRTIESSDPIQVILEDYEWNMPLIDVSHESEDRRDSIVENIVKEQSLLPFDLANDAMLRAVLIKRDETSYVLSMSMHHIASDGWSQQVLLDEFVELYQAHLENRESLLPELGIQYADYAQWQLGHLTGETLERSQTYWTRKLQGIPKVHSLPLDRARPGALSYTGSTVTTNVTGELHRKLNALARKLDATTFMLMQAAFSVLLSRFSNESDIVVGTPVANREMTQTASLIGYFANTLVLRTNLDGNPSFTSLLDQCKSNLLDAYEHQHLPFDLLVEILEQDRSLSYSPVFQVMLVMQNRRDMRACVKDLSVNSLIFEKGVAKHDLTLYINESDTGLQLVWEFATAIFSSETVDRIAQSFTTLLTDIMESPQKRVQELSLLSPEQESQLAHAGQTSINNDIELHCLHEYFERQSKLTPDKVALEHFKNRLTFKQLDQQANRLANRLSKLGVRPDSLVIVCLNRSMEMIVSVLAIFKAGGAYVPVDPRLPRSRQDYILSDSGSDLVITHSDLLKGLPITTQKTLCVDIDEFDEDLNEEFAEDIASPTLGNLAYVIYTSGSTGKPKGVLLEHGSLANLAVALKEYLQRQSLNIEGGWGQNASLSFDVSLQALSMMCMGGKLVVIPEEVRADVRQMGEYCDSHDVDFLDCTPTIAAPLCEYYLSSSTKVPTLIVGGEEISQKLWDELSLLSTSKNVLILNAYGPSETTIYSTWQKIESGRPSIGVPVANVEVSVLSSYAQRQPVGVTGELHFSGRCLARGYLNKPALTHEKFELAGTEKDAGKRFYKSGDLVRWRAGENGEPTVLEFIGRVDNQVKINGYRVELGDIESNLLSSTEVADVIVTAHKEPVRICAHVIPSSEAKLSELGESEQTLVLRQHLSSLLPHYMIPTVFNYVDEFPVNNNGKVDRLALGTLVPSESQQEYVPPQTENETRLCSLWQSLLGVKQVGVHDNFFTLGGHSLRAVRLVASIESEWGFRLEVKDVFYKQTVYLLAQELDLLQYLQTDQQALSSASSEEGMI